MTSKGRKRLKNSISEVKRNNVINTLLESIAEGVIIVDTSGKIIYVNNRFTGITGYEKDEIIGESLSKLIPLKYRNAHDDYSAEYLKDPQIRPMGMNRELFGRHKSGKSIPLEISLSYLHFKEGLFVIAFITDISKRKKIQDKLKIRNEELDSFAHTLAHDLNSIINSIVTASSLLLEDIELTETEKIEVTERIYNSSLKMSSITNGLLLFASLTKSEVEFSVLDMELIIASAKQRVAELISESDAVVKIENRLHEALGVESWIEEVWYNLLSNAIKYGGNPPVVKISSEKVKSNVEFRITDNGAGLSEEDQRTILQNPGKVKHPKIEGHGFGLEIVKRILRKLNGKLYVESKLNAGSTFIFSLKQPDKKNADTQ